MNKLNLKLQYCHGISSLSDQLDFSEKDFLLYAPNGSMKTSLYNTVYEYKHNLETHDVFFPNRISIREIADEYSNPIPTDSIVVVGNGDYDLPNDNISSLLVNSDLKKKYDKLNNSLDKIIKVINKSLKALTGENINTLLIDLEIDKISQIPGPYFDSNGANDKFENLKYKDFFNKDYLESLSDEDVTQSINDYILLCNKIVEDNPIFVKDIFELYNLVSLKKSLDSNRFFNAGHELKLLTDRQKKTYTDYGNKEIDALIEEVSQTIAEDEAINNVNRTLTSKIKSQELNIFLSKNKWIIPLLNDISQLKKDYWHYILSHNPELSTYINEYKSAYESNLNELEDILKESVSEDNYGNWNDAITIFNNKFINMPFELEISNMSDVILKRSACSLTYKFHDLSDTNNNVSVETLKENLSKGERKAFNILNLIFEIQLRIKNNQETFIFIDDIADSFDYKNKYAIVEFLKELNDNNLFHLIIMTHNFDFYRLCANQLNVNTKSVVKNSSLLFTDFSYRKNVFSFFKEKLNEDLYFLASIPFVRNIVELSFSTSHQDYVDLTSALHYKNNTSSLTISDINTIYNRIINKNSTINNSNYLSTLFSTADSITSSTNAIALENKLCLSIAIRLKFEMKLFDKINSWSIVAQFTNNQTRKMTDYCIHNNLLSTDEIRISQKVNIMTSENIHVNSFMYEPIIDMSDDELISLYNEVRNM